MQNYSTDLTRSIFSNNLKSLLAHEHMNQKEFAAKLQVTEATISNYCNEKLPSTDFLLRLKHLYQINIDDFLNKTLVFKEAKEAEEISPLAKRQTDIYKYYGIYNMYYLDNASSESAKKDHLLLNTSPALKHALLYIYHDPAFGNSKAGCLAVINLSDKTHIAQMRQRIDAIAKKRYEDAVKANNNSAEGIPSIDDFRNDVQTAMIFQNELLKNQPLDKIETVYRTYNGQMHLTQNHMHLILQQSTDFEEPISIVLHRKYFRKNHYIGGLGCMTIVSGGHPSEPCVQLVGVSDTEINSFDYDIQKKLRFRAPLELTADKKQQSAEERQLLKLAEYLYKEPEQSGKAEPVDIMYMLSQEDKEILFRSKLNYLLQSNAEKNLLFFSRITLDDDHEWYRLITGKNKDVLEHANAAEGENYEY